MALLTGENIDEMFSWPPGRAERMAKKSKLPSIKLADGSIRFEQDAVLATMQRSGATQPLITGNVSPDAKK